MLGSATMGPLGMCSGKIIYLSNHTDKPTGFQVPKQLGERDHSLGLRPLLLNLLSCKHIYGTGHQKLKSH